MAWTLEFDRRAERDLAKLDKPIQREILSYLRNRVAETADPRAMGKALSHDLSGLWRYRVRDYRIVCQLLDDRLIVMVVAVGHRSKVYE